MGNRTMRRRGGLILSVIALMASAALVAPGVAVADPGDMGVEGPSFTGTTAPTADKPQSKLWFHDGRWWGSMFDAASATWRIHYLDRAAQTWVATDAVIDTRASTLNDALVSGDAVYIASHVRATSSANSLPGNPATLSRYTYNDAADRYVLDAGYPTTITDRSSEVLTIDKDTTGRIWSTWTQNQQVWVNSFVEGVGWGTPVAHPNVLASGLSTDDISSIVEYNGKIGLMWSSQPQSAVYFSSYDPATPGSWSEPTRAFQDVVVGSDDHIAVRALQSDPEGRIFAVIKTSGDLVAGGSADEIVVLKRDVNGIWTRATFAQVRDCHTRPVLVLDTTNNLVRVYATAPDSGCPFSGTAGTIFEKTSPMDALSFTTGRGTPVIKDADSPNMNNVTTTKDSVNAGTGLVLLASDDVRKRYWFTDISLGTVVATPTADFSLIPSAGTAPVAVQFTDLSAGTPTSWAWNFGDGTTSTEQHPNHVYTAPGSYTVTLTATNAGGSHTVTRQSVVIVQSPAQAPVASFTSGTTTGTAPLSVPFTDTSTGSPTSWSWNFGDGTTSTQQNPTKVYSTPGAYTVTLTATNASGSHTVTRTDLVVVSAPAPAPVASFTPSATTGVAPSTVAFTDTSTGSPTSWSWNFGNNKTSTQKNPSAVFATPGTYTVTLTATNAHGSSTTTRTVVITAPAVPITWVRSYRADGDDSKPKAKMGANEQAGDVMFTTITLDESVTIKTVPAGWTQVVAGIALVEGGDTEARMYVYSHVVTAADVAAAAKSGGLYWYWTASKSDYWGAITQSVRGVNTANPVAQVKTATITKEGKTLSVPGVLVPAGGAVIGGLGVDSTGTAEISAPSGWVNLYQTPGGQVTGMAHRLNVAAGQAPATTWTISSSRVMAGWSAALNPAS